MAGWTDPEDDKIRKGVRDGLSAAQIAETLEGRSRNSVIGRAHRLDIDLPGNPELKSKMAREHMLKVHAAKRAAKGGAG